MKLLHAISLILSTWIFLVAFIADDLSLLIFGRADTEIIFELMKWDNLFIGLTLLTLHVVMATMDQIRKRLPGIKAMHYLSGVIVLWIIVSPFSIITTYDSLFISHIVSGSFLIVFSLLQFIYEE